MKHTTSRILFAYWDSLRGERAAPERREVQPGAMRHILADTFVLGLDESRRPTFRLAGTRLSALFCRNLGGTGFDRMWSPDEEAGALHLIDVVLEETVGAILGIRGRNENGSELPLEMLLLPLRHRGRTDARLIGALSPATVPSWAGLVPIAALELTSTRIIEPARPRDTGRVNGSRRRNLFIVHEGGLA